MLISTTKKEERERERNGIKEPVFAKQEYPVSNGR
jgi:hypothetical protein